MNCDPLARWYRLLEYLTMGQALERRRREFLSSVRDAECVLILGDGDGRFTEQFRAANPDAVVHCVDSSAKMLSVAQARVLRAKASSEEPQRGQITFHHADARHWEPPAGAAFDLVATHFFLDCFEEEEAAEIIRRYSLLVRPGGRWVVSEFHVPAAGWSAWRARLWIAGLYRVFGWVTGLAARSLPRYRPALEAAGFRLKREVTADAGMLVSELWEKDHSTPSADERDKERT